jgi:hypothetical protein
MRDEVNLFTRLFHKHDYIPFSNIHGDLINHLNGRTVMKCFKCGKEKLIKKYIAVRRNDYGN